MSLTIRPTSTPVPLCIAAVAIALAILPGRVSGQEAEALPAPSPADSAAAEPSSEAGAEVAPEAIVTGQDSASARPGGLRTADVLARALAYKPQLREDSVAIEIAQNRVRSVKRGAILPKLELSVAFGPAPGFRYSPALDKKGDTSWVRQYDWWPIGPYFGTEFQAAQPLNIARFLEGLTAARAAVEVERANLAGKGQDALREASEYYFSFQLANTLLGIVREAKDEVDRAQADLQKKVDEEAEGASQEALIQLKIGRYAVDKGYSDAYHGLQRATRGLRFALGIPADSALVLADSSLRPLPSLPSIDTLRALARYPQLRQLQAGLKVRNAQVGVARGELGPDIFIFGSFQYTKAWVSNRQERGSDVLISDPLNDVTGAFGVGCRWRLNVWDKINGLRRAQLDLSQLERKQAYAARGLELLLEDAYEKYLGMSDRQDALEKALTASEGWLKGVAMQVDLDPDRSAELVDPFKRTVELRRDYWQAVFDRNMAIVEVLRAGGLLDPELRP